MRWSRPAQKVLLLAIVVVLVAAACGGDGDDADVAAADVITADLLTGTWRGTQCVCNVVYEADGTYRIEQSRPVEQGNWTLDGTTLTLVSNEDTLNCEAGDRLIVQVVALEDGTSGQDRIRQDLVEDDCAIRGSIDSVTLERVS